MALGVLEEGAFHDFKTMRPVVVVLKYLSFMGDFKRAMDGYASRIFMNGMITVVMQRAAVAKDTMSAAAKLAKVFEWWHQISSFMAGCPTQCVYRKC